MNRIVRLIQLLQCISLRQKWMKVWLLHTNYLYLPLCKMGAVSPEKAYFIMRCAFVSLILHLKKEAIDFPCFLTEFNVISSNIVLVYIKFSAVVIGRPSVLHWLSECINLTLTWMLCLYTDKLKLCIDISTLAANSYTLY